MQKLEENKQDIQKIKNSRGKSNDKVTSQFRKQMFSASIIENINLSAESILELLYSVKFERGIALYTTCSFRSPTHY